MDRYYYLVAQLPVLSFDRESPLSPQEFLEEGEKWLSPRIMRRMRSVSALPVEPVPGPRTWILYQEFEKAFRNDLARWRMERSRGNEARTTVFPPSLVKEGNPLEVEKKCLHWRWQRVEELEEGHDFDLDFLFLYLVKLHILQRLAIFDREKGMQVFRELREQSIPGQPGDDESTYEERSVGIQEAVPATSD